MPSVKNTSRAAASRVACSRLPRRKSCPASATNTTHLAKHDGLTVVSLVGVNGAGKTTTAAKLAHRVKADGGKPMLAACDTFRAAAIEQLNLWGTRLDIPVVSSNYGADPASIAHDAANSALGNGNDYLFIDTAGRLHTKHNLMRELEKLHRVIGNKVNGAPHETLLVIDASTGMNALNQAREFNKSVPLTGLVITKLDGTSRGGMVGGHPARTRFAGQVHRAGRATRRPPALLCGRLRPGAFLRGISAPF